MTHFQAPVSIKVHRTMPNVIEYSVTTHDPLYGNSTRTYHANRAATFFGPHTGAPGRQLTGGARTLWRADDNDLAVAFHRQYPGIRQFSLA